MPQCELCGGEGPLTAVTVEGVSMKACSKCSKFGVSQQSPFGSSRSNQRPSGRSRSWQPPVETEQEFVLNNAGDLLKAEREKRGLRQIDMSRMLNMKESILHQFESKHTIPTIEVVKKIESGLGIKLIGKRKEAAASEMITETRPRGPSTFTLGDLIAAKMKK